MTCCEAEPLLALWVEEDLAETAALAAHVEQCGECAVLLAELRESQSLLRTLKHDEPSAETLADVRRRVLANGAVSKGWKWWATVAAAAAVVTVGSVGLLLHAQRPTSVSVVLPAPVPLGGLRSVELVSLPPPPRQVRVTPAVEHRRAGIRGATLVPRGGAAPALQLQTENPNVLIVLVPETGEDFHEIR